jgi:hypothetical protein
LVATLLLVAAIFGASAGRMSTPRAASSIVSVDKFSGANRELPESREVSTLSRPRILSGNIAEDRRFGPAAVLETSLFQRPPPSHSCVRS